MNNNFKYLVIDRIDELLIITLNRPEKANPLSPEVVKELIDLLNKDFLKEGFRSIAIKGAGKHFSAGADLSHIQSIRYSSLVNNLYDSDLLKNLFLSILYHPLITISLVHGACVAGGMGLAFACDFTIASSNAKFMLSETRIGFVPALVSTFLSLKFPTPLLYQMVLNPSFQEAEQLHKAGVIYKIVDEVDLLKEAQNLSKEISKKTSPNSIYQTKLLLLQIVGKSLRQALEYASIINAQARKSDECIKGIDHFLSTKKPPTWL